VLHVWALSSSLWVSSYLDAQRWFDLLTVV
jgi:hypothetical protein